MNQTNKTNNVLDATAKRWYFAANPKGGFINMNATHKTNLPLNVNPKPAAELTYEEKAEWVNAVQAESRALNKPIYKVCGEYGLKMYNYYNWSKALLKREYKAKAKAEKQKAKSDRIAALHLRTKLTPEANPIKQMPITQKPEAVKKFPNPPTKFVGPIKNTPQIVKVGGGKFAVIVTDKENLGELLKELNL